MDSFGGKAIRGCDRLNMYQYRDGKYLPASSQPTDTVEFEINTKKYTPHSSTRYINVELGTNGVALKKNGDGRSECVRDLPELYLARENCCGCTACFAICPVDAILMRPDEEGFLYPVVDAMKCVRCYRCVSVCAFKEGQREKGYIK